MHFSFLLQLYTNTNVVPKQCLQEKWKLNETINQNAFNYWLIPCSKTLLNVFHYMCMTILWKDPVTIFGIVFDTCI